MATEWQKDSRGKSESESRWGPSRGPDERRWTQVAAGEENIVDAEATALVDELDAGSVGEGRELSPRALG